MAATTDGTALQHLPRGGGVMSGMPTVARLTARVVVAVACASLLLLPRTTASQTRESRSAEAMAFIRVIGDVEVEFT